MKKYFRIIYPLLLIIFLIFCFVPQNVVAANYMVQPLMMRHSNAAAGTWYGGVTGIAIDATENIARGMVSVAGTISELYIRTSVALPGGTSIAYTLRVNGADTALTATVWAAASSGYNTTSIVNVVAGDYIDYKIIFTGVVGALYSRVNAVYKNTTANQSILASNTYTRAASTQYGQLMGGNAGVATNGVETDIQTICPTAGVIDLLYVGLSTNPGAAASGDAYSITLRKNNADTALTCTILEVATTGTDLVNSVAVAAGDILSVKIVPINVPANSPYAAIGMRFTSTIDYESIVMGSSADDLNPAAVEYNSIHASSYEYGGGTSHIAWTATEANTYHIGTNMSYKKFYVWLDGSPDNGAGTQSYTFTLRTTGASTNLDVTISEASTTGNDTTDEFSTTPGVYIDIMCTPMGTPTARDAAWGFVAYYNPAIPAPTDWNQCRLYDYYITSGDAGGSQIYGANIGGQTYIPQSSYTVCFAKISLQRTGNPGTLRLSIYLSDGSGFPTGDELTYGTFNGDLLGTAAYAWTTFTMAEEVSLEKGVKYVLVLSAIAGSGGNYVQWYWDTAGVYIYGNAILSTDGGSSWSAFVVAGNDYLFEVWGTPALYLIDARVYEGYKQDGDWLIVCDYVNKTAPHYPNDDVTRYFNIQLLDDTLTVRANTPCQQWGQKPGSIYQSAVQVIPLEWQPATAYTVRIIATYDATIYADYELLDSDWEGVDLDRLDTYCFDIAHSIEDNAVVGTTDASLTVDIANKGEVLNDTGAVYFVKGVPGLMEVRPNIFQTTTNPNTNESQGGISYRPAWQDMLGPYIADGLTDIGDIGGVNGRTMGVIFLMLSYLGVMSAFGTGHNAIAFGLSFPFLILGVYTGLFEVALFAISISIIGLLFVRQLWMSR